MNRARQPGPVNPHNRESIVDSVLHEFTEVLGTFSRGIRSALHGFPTPGPLGRNDHADPNLFGRGHRHAIHGRGPVGSHPPAITDSLGKVPAGNSTKATNSVAQKSTPPGTLAVSRGQVTFDAEGNDVPRSPYFSRHVHWPGNAESGVTLGRGYDMGNRTEADVSRDLVKAGLDEPTAKKFAAGAQKKGPDAKKFVTDNQATLGEISREVQAKLFENIYPDYVARARKNYDTWTVDAQGNSLAGKVEWGKLDSAIQDILVDFVYQGFTKGKNPMVKGMKNDFDELATYVEANETMQKYEAGRHRADYLRKAQKATSGASPLTSH